MKRPNIGFYAINIGFLTIFSLASHHILAERTLNVFNVASGFVENERKAAFAVTVLINDTTQKNPVLFGQGPVPVQVPDSAFNVKIAPKNSPRAWLVKYFPGGKAGDKLCLAIDALSKKEYSPQYAQQVSPCQSNR